MTEPNYVSKDEHFKSISRVNNRVDKLDKLVSEIKFNTDAIKKSSEQMWNVMYGTKEDGLLFRFKSYCTKQNVQWWLIAIILGTILTVAIRKG